MANEAETITAEGLRILEQMRSFLGEHPEVASALGIPAPAGPPVPLTVGEILHDVINHLGHGVDPERRDQMHGVISEWLGTTGHDGGPHAPEPAEDTTAAAPSSAPPAPASPSPAPAPAAAPDPATAHLDVGGLPPIGQGE
jgi:hypothetical protein